MFKNPFSFNGRIRRTEFGISSIIGTIAYAIIYYITFSGAPHVALIIYIPVVWFTFAQSAKRCHDRGNNGWYQFIPFYYLWMLFADSEPGDNFYGSNPKGVGTPSVNQ